MIDAGEDADADEAPIRQVGCGEGTDVLAFVATDAMNAISNWRPKSLDLRRCTRLCGRSSLNVKLVRVLKNSAM